MATIINERRKYLSLYTLRTPITDEYNSILNGMIFTIKRHITDSIEITDPINHQLLMTNTQFVEFKRDEKAGTLWIKLESGLCLDLIQVSAVLPTKDIQYVYDSFDYDTLD